MLLKEEKIFNYLNGFSDQEEAKEIETMLSESEENRIEFEKIKRIHEFSLYDAKAYNPNIEEGWSKVSGHLFPTKEIQMPLGSEDTKSFNLQLFFRIAAMLVIAVGISYFFLAKDDFDSFQLSYATKEGEVKEFMLSDGTRVVMNENSEFKYSEQFEGDSRKVYLLGEAFFEVAKDANKPFIIYSPSASTKVLGTSFNLRTANNVASVDVYSGRVAFGNLAEKGNNVVLVKGQGAVFQNGKTIALAKVDPNALSWKTGNLRFDGTPISKVVPVLEKMYKVNIDYDDNISKCLITSTFENKSLKQVLNVFEIIAQIKSSEDKGVILLSGPGCQ
ncbi:FecR domain-containing protein [Reichenbachiella sp. MALMAid0571]|uniref:FecR family protein n=1 Tax=Reichenbachiella sp. MALMAid0571 TaxID=3143939 RepID=UPI0032E04E0A